MPERPEERSRSSLLGRVAQVLGRDTADDGPSRPSGTQPPDRPEGSSAEAPEQISFAEVAERGGAPLGIDQTQHRNPSPDAPASEPTTERETGRYKRSDQRMLFSRPEGISSPSTGKAGTLKRTLKEFQADGMTDWAASLTYYGLLALFPGLIALVSLAGIIGDAQNTTSTLVDIIQRLAPGSASETIVTPIENITENTGRAGVFFVIGLLGSLWSASGYISAISRAANVIWETREGRPFWKLRPLLVGVSLVMVILAFLLLTASVLTGPVVRAVAAPLGISEEATAVWDVAKLPFMVLVALIGISFIYWVTPNVRLGGFKLITPGAILALFGFVLASLLFALYVANFGSYDRTYGSLGGVISLLVWLWISNCAVLLGIQLNAELERSRELKDDVEGAETEIQLAPRERPDRPTTV